MCFRIVDDQLSSIDSVANVVILKKFHIHKKCHVLTAMRVWILVFWVVTLCRFVGRHHRFKDGDGMFLRTVGIYLQDTVRYSLS